MAVSAVDNLLSKLKGVRRTSDGSTALCPAHEDHKNSLSVKEGDDRRALLKCHAGCDTNRIVAALGMSLADLFEQSDSAPSSKSLGREVAVYPYEDEHGTPIFQTVRFDPKDFRQRHSDGNGGWHWGLGGEPKKCNCPRVRLVPYRLPEILAADSKRTVIIVEGEKDADRLWEADLVATTNPMGAGTCSAMYAEWLKGRPVLILPDNDSPGHNHAHDIARALHGVAKSIRVLELPELPEKGDVSNWLDAGGTPEKLVALARKVPEWEPPETPAVAEIKPRQGFQFTSLTDLLIEPPEAIDYIWEKTLPSGGVSIMAAKPKVGKSTTARCLALAIAKGEDFLGRGTTKGAIVYLALEEKRSEVQAHFARMGASGEEIYLHFGSSPEDGLQELEIAIGLYRPALVIIDPLMRFIRVRDSNDYAEMTRAMEPLMTMARLSGAHILCVHHAGKGDREGGDSILGSTAIFGSVDTALIMRKKGAGRTLESIQRYGEDLPETVIGLDVETGTVSDAGTLAEVETAAAAVRLISAIGDGAMTQDEIRASVEGTTKYVIAALHQLHKNGDLQRNGAGKRNAPFTYSNVKIPSADNDDEKSGFPVRPIYRELANWKNQNNFVPEGGDQRTDKNSGSPEQSKASIEQPELLKLETEERDDIVEVN